MNFADLVAAVQQHEFGYELSFRCESCARLSYCVLMPCVWATQHAFAAD